MKFVLLFSLILQTTAPVNSPFTEKERSLYSQKHTFGERMEFFDDVVARYRREFDAYNRRKDFEGFITFLDSYGHLLKIIDEDVREMPGDKKGKSKALRKLEIQLRKSKEDLQSFKPNAGAEQQTVFESAITQSESVRTRMLQIIFGKDFLKDK